MNLVTVGRWALIAGLILAVLSGFAEIEYLPVILFVLGLIVGFLNVTEKESTPFLVAVIALLLAGVAIGQLAALVPVVASIVNNFTAFVAAAGLVVALKQVIAVAKPTA